LEESVGNLWLSEGLESNDPARHDSQESGIDKGVETSQVSMKTKLKFNLLKILVLSFVSLAHPGCGANQTGGPIDGQWKLISIHSQFESPRAQTPCSTSTPLHLSPQLQIKNEAATLTLTVSPRCHAQAHYSASYSDQNDAQLTRTSDLIFTPANCADSLTASMIKFSLSTADSGSSFSHSLSKDENTLILTSKLGRIFLSKSFQSIDLD